MLALGMTLQNIPIFLQFILVVSDKLARSSVTFVLDGDHFQSKRRSRDVHIRALLVTGVVFLFQPGASIDGESGVANVCIFVDVDPAERRVDVHVLVLALLVLLYIDATGGHDHDRGHCCWPDELSHPRSSYFTADTFKPAPRRAIPGTLTGNCP